MKFRGQVVTLPQEKVSKAAKKQQILNDLEESAKWVKLHQDGKVQAKLLNNCLMNFKTVPALLFDRELKRFSKNILRWRKFKGRVLRWINLCL